jgi:hypothetical protein
MDRQTDGQTDTQTDRQTNRQTDRQTRTDRLTSQDRRPSCPAPDRQTDQETEHGLFTVLWLDAPNTTQNMVDTYRLKKMQLL